MRFLLTVLLLVSAALHAKAQAGDEPALFSRDEAKIFHAGVNLGANFCQVDGDTYDGYRKVGIAGGALVYVRVLPIVHVSLGLGYAQKGSRQSDIRDTYLGPAVFRYRVDLNYVELPLMFHLFLGGRLHYSAGISYARLLSSKEEAEDVNPIIIKQEYYPFIKEDWSGIVSINAHIYGRFFLQGQFQYTLGSIRDQPYIPPGYGSGHQRNNVMSVRLLYIIPSGAAR